MKNLLKFIVCVLSIVFMMAFKSYRASLIPVIEIETKSIVLIPIKIENPKLEIKLTGHQQFLDAIGHRESGNRYNIVNKYGYMGKYQFGKATLKGLGIKVSNEEFINSPELQEKAMQLLLEHNKKKLKRYIKKYEGTIVHGVYITESGILAAAHLGGQGNVRKFFRNGYEFKDGFGTNITSYMELFSNYKLKV
jgi:hypothetical protein|tara:strand:+ start:1411 stop:1989 length:579 start_codon:yes stop_codon:yes gene_type:complete